MNEKRTELTISKNSDKLLKESRIMTIGSQFSNMLAKEFQDHNFHVKNNTFGNIYNPLSIYNALELAVKNKPLDESLITQSEGKWNHYNFHPSLGTDTREELITKLNGIIQETNDYLKHTDFLILTLGSAYAFSKSSNKKIVANCHKNPSDSFNKSLLSTKEIVEGFRHIFPLFSHVKNIIFVVSPILQLNDSLTLNTVSKSTLRLACHMIKSEFPHVKYFPAFELLKSDLRDYKYYEADLVTPTQESMNYIFKKFLKAYVE